MNRVPSGTELARPFLPTKDFDRSKSFYEAIGFEKTLDGEVAIFHAGSGGFILQRHFHEDWAANCMMQLMVDDIAAWWAHIESLELSERFGVPPPKAPAMQPWGLLIAYASIPLACSGTSRSGVRGQSMTIESGPQLPTPNRRC